MDIEEKEDKEISIDFSKIKKLFKRKKEKEEETGEKKGPEEKKEIDKEDEEINIDFSKIKNLFKRKEEKLENKEIKKLEESKEQAKESEEEIDFDFSKIKGTIKNIFKGLKEKSEKEKGEEEVSLDIRKTIDFFKKYQKFILPTLLIIIAISFSVYLRIQPAYLPVTDDWATNSVYNQIKSSIKGQISNQYPNLPDANKNELVDAEFEKILKIQKAPIEQQIKATSSYFRSTLQNDKGETHLLDIDTYYWVRHAQNVLKNGHPGDELRDGKPYDNHMYAPIGRFIPPDMFYAYFQAYLYKFVRFFNRDLDFITFVFYVPAILSILMVIPAFFIGRRLGSNLGGFVAAFIVVIHPSLLTRSAGGVIDTDMFNVLFPLLITWLFLEALETKNKMKIIALSVLAGFFVGLFSFTWSGWWYIFDFILVTSLAYLFFQLILHRKKLIFLTKEETIKDTLLLMLVFFISCALFVSLFSSFQAFKDAFTGPQLFTKMKQVAIKTVWPNVYTTVAEQNPASLDSVISQISIGSTFLLLLALTGITLTTIKKEIRRTSDLWFFIGSILWFMLIIAIRPENLITFLVLISIPLAIKLLLIIKERDTSIDARIAILLILWFISTVYASTKGIRYLLLGVPAFGIALSGVFGMGYYYLARLINRGLKINKGISKIITLFLLFFILFGPYKSAYAIVRSEIPLINDAWYNSLKKINLESKPNAIVNSWWDFGHWFKMIADRPVTFDGTSQGSANAHWIGSVLLTDDEDYAIGVLRMVDCGQNNAFDKLNIVIKDVPKSISILEEVVRLNKENAKNVLLQKGLDEEEANSVLNYTHCEPPDNYFITSYDMIGKSGVWAHFGSWDFERALIYNTLKKREYIDDIEKSISFLQGRYNHTRKKAEDMYYEVQSIASDTEANSWIAPWPSYAGSTSCGKIEQDKISCGIAQGANIEIDLKTLQADVPTMQGIKHPNSIVLPTKEGYKERKFNDTIGVSMTLIPSGEDSYNAILSSQELAKSMFTIMFYLNGHGLRYFDKFSDVRDITGGRIIVWKVNWQGDSTNLLEYYQQKREEELKKVEEEFLSINNSQDINNATNSKK